MWVTQAQLMGLLDDLGWRPETLARKLSDYAEFNGFRYRVHAKTPYKWLAGACPRAPWPDLIAALLSAELGRPVTPAELGWASARGIMALPADSGMAGPWTVEGALRSIHAVIEADPMQRRLFLTLAGAAISAPAHQWLLAEPVTRVARASGTRVQASTVTEIDTMTASLRRMDDRIGGGTLLHMVRAHLHHVLTLLRHGSYDDSVGRRLHASVAELLRLAGWLSFDNGEHARAQRYWVAALRTAHTAGDQALAANILGFMSCQAKDLNQPREAALLAETALSGCPHARGAVAAILHLRAAEAHATEGAAVSVDRALDAAFTNLDCRVESAPDWSYWLDEVHAHGQAGYCYLRLGQYTAARRHLRAALAGDDSDSREGALRSTLLAATYARQSSPDLERTLAYAGKAVGLLTDRITSPRCVEHLSALVTDLAAYRRHPGVRELDSSVRALRSHNTIS